MAALLLRRSLQRREFASISSFASLAGKSQHSPLLESKFSSLIRPFSSRPAGNDVIGIDLGTTNSCVAVMEGKRISTSRQLLANSDATPIPSPLTPLLWPSTGNAETQAAVFKHDKVQAVLKGIKQSPKKLNLVAAVVRGMRVEDALLQMQVTVKRAAKTVYQVIHSARANATHNHSLDPDRLVVAEAYVGKGLNKKRVSFHAKGRSGIMIRPVSRLTVVVREMTPEEEAQLARLRVHNFKKLSKKEHRLVPHQLIESNPIWGRKNSKARSTRSETLD